MDKLCAEIFTSNAHQIMSLTSHLLGKIGLYSAAKRVLWFFFFSFFFFYGDPVQCLVKALSQSQFIATESYHMTSLPKLRLCEKQFQVIYTTAIPLLKEALIFFPSFY